MSAIFTPQGLVPIYHPIGLSRPERIDLGIDVTVTQTFKKGSPVRLTASGLIVPIANLAWAAASDDLIGVFNGVEYSDTTGRHESNQWVGPNTAATNLVVYVWLDEKIEYDIQANGSVAATAIGNQFNFSAFESGSAFTGLSNMSLNPTPVGAGTQGYVRCVNQILTPENAFGDAFTRLRVQIAAHEFIADKVAV